MCSVFGCSVNNGQEVLAGHIISPKSHLSLPVYLIGVYLIVGVLFLVWVQKVQILSIVY